MIRSFPMQLFANALIAGSLAALIAGGLALVYGVLGVFNMALGQLTLIGGYCTWWLHQVAHVPLLPSVIGGLIAGGLITWFTFEIFVNPFYKHHRFLPLVTTIAWSMILDGLMLLLFEERPRSIMPGLKNTFEIWGARISTEQCVLIGLTLLALFIFAYIFHRTSFGRKLRAVVQQESAAQSLGINSAVLHRVIFIVSGVFAGAGGIFIGIDQNLSPTFAFPLTIKAYAAIIAGGKGNIWGAIVCAYLIAVLEQVFVGVHWFGLFYVPAGYQQTVALLFIIFFLLLKPSGLFSSKSRTA
ncbi:MAG: branched-chain amino acid ABC transporter permease [Patescibacteria group bacterium]